MRDCVIIIDNSNIWIEGKKFSAKVKGAKKTGNKAPDDPSWRVDFGRLINVVADGKAIKEVILVGSRPPVSDTLWDAIKKRGIKVTIHDRNWQGKEKAVDTELATQGSEIICNSDQPAVLKLLSGDGDFVPLIDLAHRREWETEMWAFTSAFKSDGIMAQRVTRIRPLDNDFQNIGWCEFDWRPTSK